jgi:hypothetical protein
MIRWRYVEIAACVFGGNKQCINSRRVYKIYFSSTFACHATVEKRGLKEPLDQNRVSGKGSSFSLSFDSINAIKSFS